MSYTYNFYDKITEPVDEAYKVLRSNIGFNNIENKIKTISVISSTPKEGKTTVSINLSISLAYTNKRVLLVDADLRKPEILKKTGENIGRGISDYLLGKIDLQDVIYNTNIKNLFYVPSGVKTQFPSELLQSDSFSAFLKEVKEKFDYIIFDSSALNTVIDAALIASKTDGTLIVLASGKVASKNFELAKQQLDNASAKVLGVVLNNVSKNEYSKFFNYYSKFKEVTKKQLKGNK
jgi:capsular exopolysaccharide synthesis family protein